MTNIDHTIESYFLDWRLDTDEPSCSSYQMENAVASIIKQGGTMGDIYRILYRLLKQRCLSTSMAFFIKRICTLSFSHYRDNYEASDFLWYQRELSFECSPPQAMLVYRIVPYRLCTPQSIVSTMKALMGTEEWGGVVGTHDDDAANSPELRELLRKWLAEGVPSECRADVERMAEGRPLT